jgi:hypothetical protein
VASYVVAILFSEFSLIGFKNGELLMLWQNITSKRALTTEYYCFKMKPKSTSLKGKQLKGQVASHVVAFNLFQNLPL